MVKTSVYVGNTPSDVLAASNWLGRTLDATQVFVGHASWADWMGSMPWLADLFKDIDVPILWSLPLIPQGATLEAAAAGSYDDKYLQMAKQFVANSAGSGEINVRVGWEFNGDWFPWNAIGKEGAYVGAYRHLVDAFRTVSDRFVFEWTPNIGDKGVDLAAAYPGDNYVDVIGMDFYYDRQWDSRDQNAAWNWMVKQKYGLQWHQDFAAQHGKPTAYAEWGVNSDSPAFIKLAQQWFAEHDVIYQNYWNSNGAFEGQLSTGQYPLAAAAFKEAFGVTVYNGTSGDDVLTGGSGENAYVLSAGGGHDVVTNFKQNDKIILDDASGGRPPVVTLKAGGILVTATDGSSMELRGAIMDLANRITAGGQLGKTLALINGRISIVTDAVVRIGTGASDAFYVGGALTAASQVDGGAGDDALLLQGNYAMTLGPANLVNVEALTLLSGSDTRFGDAGTHRYSYDLTSVDANVDAGTRLLVQAGLLQSGENFRFDGSAEKDGSFLIYGGMGRDTVKGGAGNDTLLMATGRFNPGDTFDGGAGNDTLILRGHYAGADAVTFAPDAITNIEALTLLSAFDTRFGALGDGYSYTLTMHDGNVAAGMQLIVNGSTMRAGEVLMFDGSAERDGSFRILAGAGNDVLIGGAGNDVLLGGRGADDMTGGGGNDTFRYDSVADSTISAMDLIRGFTSGQDRIDLVRIDANANTAENDEFTFIGDRVFSGTAGELRSYFDDASGRVFVQGDVDGDGLADFMIGFDGSLTQPLHANDFIL